jgi:hypothetical protein
MIFAAFNYLGVAKELLQLMTIFMLLDDRVQEDILDFRSHFKFYLIKIEHELHREKIGILVKEKKQ